MEGRVVLNEEYIRLLEKRVLESNRRDGSPEVITGCYAARKTKSGWKFSNGRTWWDDPVLVREFHGFRDGCMTAHNYIEGLGTMDANKIMAMGMVAAAPSELLEMLQVQKYVYYDHAHPDQRGRAIKYTLENTYAVAGQ